MSYILEALRRSQQERELGNVPTLETEVYTEPAESRGINPWVLAALALAALAVVIALYAAFQAGSSTSGQGQSTPPPAKPPSTKQHGEGTMPLEDQNNLSVTNRRLAPSVRGERSRDANNDDVVTGGHPPRPWSPSLSLPPELPDEAPLVEPPPPKPLPAPAPIPRSRPRPAPVSVGMDVPVDVLRDIETFKEELRLEESVTSRRPVPKRPEPKNPRDLRLPKEVALRQPAFVMTVHVHEQAPDKRFVVINARKYRQGDTTREGLIVDDILPDGAILSFEGHRFFTQR